MKGLLAAALALSIISGCAASDESPQETEPSTRVREGVTSTALESVVGEFLSDADGGVVAVAVRDGSERAVSVGVANAGGDALGPDTPLYVGSISKPFVATMVLQLVDEGRIDLDEPLDTYLPAAVIGGDIPLRLLLSHRSGLPDFVARTENEVLGDLTRSFTPQEVLASVADIVPVPPDQEFSYSNSNYQLLGLLIEEVEGTDLDAALQTRISGPLGLDSTVFAGNGGIVPAGLAGAWSPALFDGDPAAPYESIATSAGGAGSLISTASELRFFLTALFDGQLLSDESLAAMTDTGIEGYGLGIATARLDAEGPGWLGAAIEPDAEPLGFGHNGSIYGYRSTMVFEPDSGDLLVVLTNNDRLDPDRLAGQIFDAW